MKRTLDLLLAVIAVVVLAIPMALLAALVRVTSPGPALYWSDRIGRHNRVFRMPKFRTMHVGTPPLATHLLTNADAYLTPVGGILRRTSLDELPQLWCILRGDMSFVGPRPALFNQDDLISLRTECGVDALCPGLTGWAQINGRDELSIPEKVKLDHEYLRNRSTLLDAKILMLTVMKAFAREGVAH